MSLIEFVRESNRIERITTTRLVEVEAHSAFLEREAVTVGALVDFVHVVADARLRSMSGMNVRITGVKHQPPPGGREVERRLETLLQQVNTTSRDPFHLHCEYESLHPFMDGNGRSGRVLWAWHMARLGRDPFALPFLHQFYYQALDASRGSRGRS